MSGKTPLPSQLSPAVSTSTNTTGFRRDPSPSASLVSSQADKDHLAQALDKIHTSANQCDVLTTFNDLAPPPDSSLSPETQGFAADLVQNGLSGLYSRFKEAVGVAGRDKPLGQDEIDNQDAASRKSSSTVATGPKASPLPRIDTSLTVSTLGSTLLDPTPANAVTSGNLMTEGNSTQSLPQSTKSSSVAALTAPSASKSASSSRQSIPNMTRPTAAVAPVTVSAFKEPSWSTAGVPDDGPTRGSGSRKSISRQSDGQASVPGLEVSSRYDVSESKSAAALEKIAIPSRNRRDDVGVDGNIDLPISPVKSSISSAAVSTQPMPDDHKLLSPTSRLSTRESARRPAVITRISGSRTRGSRSRSSSISHGTAEPSPISTSAHNSIHHDSWAKDDKPQRMKYGGYRIPGTTTDEGAPEVVNATLEHMRKQVLSKDFWMADETCKDCFHCGAPFSAFRRKHHCRTCGCIFDSRCTSIISGQKFGVEGTLRVCKPCLGIISQRQDGNMSEDDSADDSYLPAIFRPNPKSVTLDIPKPNKDEGRIAGRIGEATGDSRTLTTPMMAIPATRRIGESSNRNSAILEIDAPQLSRPSSSRSLKSLAGRPQSSGHRRHHSKHNFLSRFKGSPVAEDRAPFRRSANEEVARKSGLPAFHDDNVIDPDLAPFMSDESSGDEQMSIFQTMSVNEPNPSSFDHDKSNFGSYLGAGRRNRLRTQAEKSVSGFSFIESSGSNMHPRSSRRRNTSIASASIHHLRSPRQKAATLKGPGASTETLGNYDNPVPGDPPRLTRSSSMKGDKEPRVELNPASLLHVRKLLQQLLQDADVPNAAAWEKALVPILLKCTTSVDPDVERGDDIDIRHYVKLKKIPGGRPGDTSYVSGVIFTKKLALKSMPRRLANPRVVIVSFPIEYRRHQQHFMSLQPVIDEEKEFLKVIVNRIVNLRPQLVLAEKSVSGLALQYLSEANIAVAYNVKPSVLSAVSRCLETQIISSIDMLSLPVDRFQIGKSIGFEVKTFVNDEIPGKKKTYIFLSGNQEQLGCTIALRGAPTSILKKIKRITEFMVYVVYNLKLESCLMRDSFIRLPTSEEMPSQLTDESLLSLNTAISSLDDSRQRTMSAITSTDSPITTQESGESGTGPQNPSRTDTGLSQATQNVNRLVSLHEMHGRTSNDSIVPDDAPMPTFYSDMVAKYQTKILSASPFVRFAQPYLLMKAREQERRLVHLKKLRDQDIVEERVDGEKSKPQKFQLIKPQMVHQTGQKAPRAIMEVLHAVHDAEYDKALYNYQTQTRSWENYIQGNLDLFEPYAHQNIVVLHSVVCTTTKVPCVEPGLVGIAFYDEHAETSGSLDPDCTLGQYVEDICYGADSTCTGTSCDQKMYEHHRTYVHGEARITVFIEHDIKGKPPRENIMMWSYCKICKRETAEMEMSKGTWKYSFGKYLELSFWSRGTRIVKTETDGADGDGWDCPHDHHRDHIRYFGLQNKIMRVHYDPIDLLEIIVPRARITWKVEHDLNLKNEIFTNSQDRWTRFTNSVKGRLKAIKLDNIAPEKADACTAESERLTKKIHDEHVSLVRKLQDAYMESKYYEVIPLNVILREMLEKVTEWDAAFAKFEIDFLPTEKDLRRLTMLQLRKMFTDESKESLSSNEATTEENSEKTSQTTVSDGDSKPDTLLSEKDPLQTPTNLEDSSHGMFSGETPMSENDDALDRVDSLDLATPNTPRQSSMNPSQSQSLVTTPLAPGLPEGSAFLPTSPVADDNTASTSAASMSVTEQVEQLRRRQQLVVLEAASGANTADGEPTTMNIPEYTKPVVPERISSRRAGLNVSPPMVRAMSQPMHGVQTVSRTQSATGKKFFGLGKDKDKTPTAETPPGNELRRVPTNESAKGDKKMFSLRSRNGGKSSIPRFVGKKKDSRVSTLARHFEQLSREFDKERRKDEKERAAKMSHSRAFLQRSTTRAIVEVYEDPDEAVNEPGPSVEDSLMDTDPSIIKGNRGVETSEGLLLNPSKSPDQTPQSPVESNRPAEETATETETDDQTNDNSQAPTDDEQGDSDTEHSLIEGPTLEEIANSIDSSTEIPLELPKQDKMNFMRVLTNFWAERSASEWPPLDYPLNATDHIFYDSDIIVREDEPSSLIAFALSCEDYRTKESKFHGRKDSDAPGRAINAGAEPSGANVWQDNSDPVGDEALEASFVRITSSHLKYQFNEGSARMLVKIFYAEQFDALRRKCGVAPRIVESLSRCLKFDSKGGKTKSVFLKTQDDRLMMKSLSPIETSAFLKFAPSYFSIMREALFHDLPSVIAKMLGFFQVIIKNPVTNTEIKLDLLLMENLFYDRAPTRIFDLKGSMRNRKIQSTGEQNEVLLDENMVEYIYESPLFAREHSKKLLRASVWNDTLFLARQDVMDYSLMIAVDETRKELVVGIIDCIRTYTWDKTLESWIKGRGFAGGGRNRPTVTSPKEYKSRFREAMARYILQAPNCWHQFTMPLVASRPYAETNMAGDEATVAAQNDLE